MTESRNASIAPMLDALRDAAQTIAEAALERALRTPTERTATVPDLRTLEALIARWEHSARRAFFDAKVETSELGRRFIRHGAMCHYNCAQELRKVLGVPLLEPSATQITPQAAPLDAALAPIQVIPPASPAFTLPGRLVLVVDGSERGRFLLSAFVDGQPDAAYRPMTGEEVCREITQVIRDFQSRPGRPARTPAG